MNQYESKIIFEPSTIPDNVLVELGRLHELVKLSDGALTAWAKEKIEKIYEIYVFQYARVENEES